jgi:hypothetical protein
MDCKILISHINPTNPPKPVRRNETASDHGSNKNDIIKADGGELKVKTMEIEGSEFIIYLPFLNQAG